MSTQHPVAAAERAMRSAVLLKRLGEVGTGMPPLQIVTLGQVPLVTQLFDAKRAPRLAPT